MGLDDRGRLRWLARRAVPGGGQERPADGRAAQATDGSSMGAASPWRYDASPLCRRSRRRCSSASGLPRERLAPGRWWTSARLKVPLRVPALVVLVDVRLDRRRRLAGADHARAGRPARPWPKRGCASRSPEQPTRGSADVEDPRQHLLFLPDTEVELTLVGNEKLDDAQLKVQPETTARAEAHRRANLHGQMDASSGGHPGNRAQVGPDRPLVATGLPLAGNSEGPGAAGHAARPRRRRSRHAGCHAPALAGRDRRLRAGGPPLAGSSGRSAPTIRPSRKPSAPRVAFPLPGEPGRAGPGPSGPA